VVLITNEAPANVNVFPEEIVNPPLAEILPLESIVSIALLVEL